MNAILLVVHILVAIALIGVVLLQRSEGGALGSLGGGTGGGMGGFMTARGSANLLTRATAVLGALFFVSSIVLTTRLGADRAPTSIVDQPAQTAPAQPATPAPPSVPLAR
jgi:preprotein translocase subunit SecG